MSNFKVKVKNDVYKDTFYGESVELKEQNNEPVVLVHSDEDGFTMHMFDDVENIDSA